VEEALEILNSAPEGTDCLVVLASWLAPAHATTLALHARKPQFLLTCARPPSCPVAPVMQSADLGCIQKPLDFWHPSIIISRVKALLSRSCTGGE